MCSRNWKGKTMGQKQTQKNVFEELEGQNHAHNKTKQQNNVFEELESQNQRKNKNKQCVRGIGKPKPWEQNKKQCVR